MKTKLDTKSVCSYDKDMKPSTGCCNICIAGIFITVVLIIYLLFWIFTGPGEFYGSDRGHLFLVGNGSPSFLDCFKIGQTDRYRPLAIYVEGLLTSIATSRRLAGWYFLVTLNGVLLGLATYLFYRITLLLTKLQPVAILASVLLLFSNATIAVPWTVLFSVFYIAPILLIYAMLHGYLMYKKSGIILWLLPVIICGILAPWFREIGVLGAMIIFGVEAFIFLRKPNVFIILPLLLLVHGLFSTAVPSLLGLYLGGIRFVFCGPEIQANFPILVVNWWRTGRVLNEIAPILWIPVVGGAAVFLYRFMHSRPDMRKIYDSLLCGNCFTGPLEQSGKENKFAKNSTKVFVLLSITAFALMFVNTASPEASGLQLRPEILLILFVAVLSIISALRIGLFVFFWFFVQLTILIKQPHNFEAHLVFIIPAICIIASVWIVDLWAILTEYKNKGRFKVLWIVVGIVIITGCLVQVQNVYLGFKTVRNIAVRSQQTGDWFKENVPPKSVIFVNSFPAFEILHRAGWIHDVRWISIAGPITHCPDYRSITDYKEQLEYVKKAYDQGRGVYYFLVTSKNFCGPYSIPKKGIEDIKVWTIRLPQSSLDPLRYFMCKPMYMQVFAPFQWRATVEAFDAKEDSTGFNIELSLSRLREKDIPQILTDARPDTVMSKESLLHIPETLVVDGYKDTNYNIIYSNGNYYGLFRGEGPFSVEKVKKGQYKTVVFIGDSQAEVEKQLDCAQTTGTLEVVSVTKDVASGSQQIEHPQLVIDGYKDTNYNIIYYQGKYYGLFRGEGAFIIEKVQNKEYKSPVFVADSLKQVKKMIDGADVQNN
ncbi:MAG: hypothetical protein K8R02_01690 [Anaerohalosphaeraceae bacterium]|nr:hypothetical protein [Anaerohalosphaeraceae bacterium]